MTVTAVRPLLRRDLEAVLAIEAEANPVPWREGDFRPFADEEASAAEARPGGARKRAWVGLDARTGGIIGFACAAAAADEVELQSVAVAASHRGRGAGTALLEALLEWARAEGCRSVHLEVRSGNAPALALYRRFGFAQAGCRRGYYPDNGEDALLLTRDIPPPVC